ncbi:MAG: HdeD family acid-resistance protein [Actinobacteria bacterium]|nr:MAG: HdeD family acid-resistance protein [Actinomycetota bacterium]
MLSQTVLEGMHRNWWVFVLRGAAAVLFGVIALIWPGVTVGVLVFLFGIYAIADGLASLISSWLHRGDPVHRGHHLGEGLLALLIGILALAWPGVTALALIVLIAIWAVLTGVVEISAAIRLRRVIINEWFLGLAGVLSVVVGIILFADPRAGALAIAIIIGIYAIVFGATMIALGVRLKRWHDQAASPAA